MSRGCESCESLKENSYEFTANGVTDAVCTSLKNDTGFSPSNSHNNCQDIQDATDCLIDNMAEEVKNYDVCDWRKFMMKYIANLAVVLTAINCSMCGIWTNIHRLWEEINALKARVKKLEDDVADLKARVTRIENQIIDILRRLGNVENTLINYGNRINNVENKTTQNTTNITNITKKLNAVSYVGILSLERTSMIKGSGSGKQAPAFNKNIRQGNIPSSVLNVTSDYKGITVKNTTGVPLLVNTTFNCSVRTDQNFQCSFIVVTRDGVCIGQTPFISPNTYDQQVMARPFILNAGQSTTLRYYFEIGGKNSWFIDKFGYNGNGKQKPQCTLEPNDNSNPENQASYFTVMVSSVVSSK